MWPKITFRSISVSVFVCGHFCFVSVFSLQLRTTPPSVQSTKTCFFAARFCGNWLNRFSSATFRPLGVTSASNWSGRSSLNWFGSGSSDAIVLRSVVGGGGWSEPSLSSRSYRESLRELNRPVAVRESPAKRADTSQSLMISRWEPRLLGLRGEHTHTHTHT